MFVPNLHMRSQKQIRSYCLVIGFFVYCPQDPLHAPTLQYGEWFLVSLPF